MTDKLLIVDDSEINRKILSHVLKNEGYELFEAVDGESALDVCVEVLPDLVLLDIAMPGMDGYQVCEAIKRDLRTADIFVIFLSANTRTAEKIKGLDLGAADYITKPFDSGEVLARIKTQLRIRHLTQALVEKQQNLEKDLQAAAEIQKSLIPKEPPDVKNFRFAWQFIPCEEIGGDLFNIHRLDESHLALYVVDVSGHGVPSAMVTVSISQTLLPVTGSILKKTSAKPPQYTIVSPVDVLSRLDREYPLERFSKYFTMSYLLLNIETGHIRYSNAGHPMPVLVRANGDIELLREGGTIIGMGHIVPFEEGETRMRPGDRLFLYTDGIIENMNDAEVEFGEENFHEALLRCRKESLETACSCAIDAAIAHGGGASPQDDITLLAVECLTKQ